MIPGSVSKLSESTMQSASTITVKTDIVNLLNSVTVNTIIPALGTAVCQFLVLNSPSGLSLGTSGNILQGVAIAQNRPVFLVWSKSAQKWLINSGA